VAKKQIVLQQKELTPRQIVHELDNTLSVNTLQKKAVAICIAKSLAAPPSHRNIA